MRKSKWRKYLNGKRSVKELSQVEQAQLAFKVRKRAIQCLEDLILIFEGMHRISRNPDKQFHKILYKDNLLPRFWKEFHLARQLAFDKSITPISLSRLMVKLTLKGIPYDVKRLIEDKNYRVDKRSELQDARKK